MTVPISVGLAASSVTRAKTAWPVYVLRLMHQLHDSPTVARTI